MAPKILSPQQVTDLIAKGNVIVIYQDHVLNLGSWLRFHPGGDKAVYHMVGRDATDEMNAYHSPETMKAFTKWSVGRINYQWKNLLPPIQGGVYHESAERAGKDKLGQLLDAENSSVELSSGGTSESEEEAPVNKNFYKSGVAKEQIVPVVPQRVDYVSEENMDVLFPVKKNVSAIVDPKEVTQNYDNELTRQDILGLPSLSHESQKNLRDRYNELHAKIIKGGFYTCYYRDYVREIVKIASIFLFAFSFLHIGWYKTSALLVGLAWQQMVFIAHDAGHVSITHNYQLDNIFGMTIASFFGGLSLGWWRRNHNVHHLITNDPVHDPDIQHLPFFAVSTRLFHNKYSTYYEKFLWFDAVARKLIPLQNYTYYPILAFGRFNLYVLSWTHVIMGLGPRHGPAAWFRWYELAGLMFFNWWFFYLIVAKSIEGGWNKFAFIMVSHVGAMLVHVQITLSHFAMTTSDLGPSESFVSRQLRTTMDVDCPEWLDFLHGGLQFQAIHHLFPRLPRHNLRRVQPLVLEFCAQVGLPYSIYGFGKGNEVVIGKLAEIGKQCSIMLDCTKKLRDESVGVADMI